MRKTWIYLGLSILIGLTFLRRARSSPLMQVSPDPKSGDPVALLFARINEWLSIGILFIILALLFFCSVLVSSLLEGVLLSSSTTNVTFLKDLAAPAHFALLNPLAIVLIMKYYQRISEFFLNLERYLDITIKQKDQILWRVQALYQHRLTKLNPYLALFGALVVVSVFFAERHNSTMSYYIFVDGHAPGPHWVILTHASASGWLSFIWATLIAYVLFMAAIKSILTIFAGKYILAYPLRYQPVHSDGSAGLRDIGRIIVDLSLILLVVGFTIAMFWVSDIWNLKQVDTFRIWASTPLFTVLAFGFLGLPLWFVHKKMYKQKNELIRRLAIQHGADSLETIAAYYSATRDLPDWPLRATGLLKISGNTAAVVIIPIVIAVLFG